MKNATTSIAIAGMIILLTGCATTNYSPPSSPTPIYVPAGTVATTNVQNVPSTNSTYTSSPVYVPTHTYKTTSDDLPVKHSTYTGSG